ncbi:lipoprotein-releasing ABC transporter permease subunit [Simiduia litorea]|uniref:lipoprotein-releasing ABC transporter permease subunit n=1 Tax=Simiduia litorea TaxID=1435348 RepID=UPI0036F208E1
MINRFPLALFIGLRYTGSKRRNQLVSFISLISMAGLAMGVALLLIVLSVMNGFDKELRERILGVMPQATVFHRSGIEDWGGYQEQFERHENVVASAPFVQLQGLMSLGAGVAPVSVYGVEASAEQRVSRLNEFIGHASLDQLADNEILLGRGVANQIQAKIGDQVSLIVPDKNEATSLPKIGVFVFAGIVDTGTEVDNGLAITTLQGAGPLSEFPGKVSGIRLKLDDLFSARQVIRDLMQELSFGFYGSEWSRSHGNIFQAVQMSRQLVGLLLFLIIAIAAFNVVSTLIMVVVDKQGQIAILRSQGASRFDILCIFTVQGGMIGVVGTAIGLALGVAGSFVVTDFVAWIENVFGIHFLASDVYPVSYLPSDFRISDCFNVGLTAVLMSFVATLYPAWRASRVEPAEALRFDH